MATDGGGRQSGRSHGSPATPGLDIYFTRRHGATTSSSEIFYPSLPRPPAGFMRFSSTLNPNTTKPSLWSRFIVRRMEQRDTPGLDGSDYSKIVCFLGWL